MTLDVGELTAGKVEIAELIESSKYRKAYALTCALLERYVGCTDLLLNLARLIQLLPDEQEGDLSLDDVALVLNAACIFSKNDPTPRVEIGFFHYAVQADSHIALAHFESASQVALKGLQNALIGQAKCKADLGDMEGAHAMVAKLNGLFPDEIYGPIFDLELDLSIVPRYDQSAQDG